MDSGSSWDFTIRNLTREAVIASETEIANSPWSRFRGLMLRQIFPDGSGLVIDPCSSIHMFFMRFPIDVLYLNRDDEVVRVQQGLRPWRIGPIYTSGAHYIVELPAGTIAATGTRLGDKISISVDEQRR